MVNKTNFNIEQFLDLSNYATDVRKSRRKNSEIKMNNEELLKEHNNGKRFDVCLMNPPYNRSLHLQFLEKTIEIANKVVSVQPIQWLQDPIAYKKKNSEYNKYNNIIKHIKSLEEIDVKKAVELFHAAFNSDIGIYELNIAHKTGCKLPIKIEKTILEKVLNNEMFLYDVVENDKRDGWRIQITEIQPNTAQGGHIYSYGWYKRFCLYNPLRSTIYKDGYKDGKDWALFNSGIKKKEGSGIPWSIKFDTENEAINFENSLKTLFYEYLVYTIKMGSHVPFKYLPWMKDYKDPWTDERFKKYFNLTKEEWNSIIETMKPFTEALKNKNSK